jgi:hypothetical protein
VEGDSSQAQNDGEAEAIRPPSQNLACFGLRSLRIIS